MATRTIAAAGGNWGTATTWAELAVPTAADDVVATALSGNLTIDAGAVCRSANFTGYTGTLTHTSGVTLTIGDATAGASNVALLLVSGMTYSPAADTCAISFVSTSATQQTVACGGKTLGNVTFGTTGGSWLLSDALSTRSTTATVTLTAGTLNTNSKNCSWGLFVSNNSNTRALTLGSSTITMTGTGNPVWGANNNTNMTTSMASATITLNGAGAGFASGSPNTCTLGTLNFTGSGVALYLTSVLNVTNLTRTGTASKNDGFTYATGGALTVSGTLTITGNSAINRMLVASNVLGTTRTITAAAVSLTNVDFMDITGAGAASPFTGTSLGDCWNNSGITFTTPTTQTHTSSAGGNWSDVTKWTSRVPLPQDSVVVNSGTTGTLGVDMPRMCGDVDFTGFAGTLSYSVQTIGFGSLTLSSGMTTAGAVQLTLQGRGTHTVTSNGTVLNVFPLRFEALTGTYSLADAISVASKIQCSSGTINTGGFGVTVTDTFSVFAGTLNASTSTFTLNNAVATCWNRTGGTINAGSSTIVIPVATSTARTFNGGGQTYGTLTYTVAGSTGSLTITGANSFAVINFSDVSNARTLILPSSTTTTVTALNINGTSGNLMSINSSTSGTAATISKTAGTVMARYVSIKDSTATGGAGFYAVNSTNVSGNTGWTFSAPTGTTQTGVMKGVATISRRTKKPVIAVMTGVGTISRVTKKPVIAVMTGVATLSRKSFRTITAVMKGVASTRIQIPSTVLDRMAGGATVRKIISLIIDD